MIEIEQTESETNDNDFRFYLKRDNVNGWIYVTGQESCGRLFLYVISTIIFTIYLKIWSKFII